MKPSRGIVVAPQSYAAEEGARILKAGGNAFDAAICTAFVQMVVDPQMCGIGGFGCLTLYDARTDTTAVVDFSCLVIGAPGGTRIMTRILQGIVNLLAFEMSAVEAVSAPRVDCQSDTLDGEARIPSGVQQAAADRAGLKLAPNPAPYGQFALVQAIRIHPDTGAIEGGADPRSGGAAITDA